MAKNKFIFLTLIFFSFGINGFSQSLSIQETINYLNEIFKLNPRHQTIKPFIYSTSESRDKYNDNLDMERRASWDSLQHLYSGCNVETVLSISIDSNGFLLFQERVTVNNCNDVNNNVNDELRISVKINVDDIDLEKMKWALPERNYLFDETAESSSTKDHGAVVLHCIDDDVKCIYGISIYKGTGIDKGQFKFKGSEYSIDIYSDDAKYDIKRLYNALMYLINSAKEQGYHRERNDQNDPFVSQSVNQRIDNSTISKKANSKAEYKIPLKQENGVFSLTANLNGIISKFILDSGAGVCSISSELEKKLLLSGIINHKDYLPNGLYKLADGSIQECRRTIIPKMIVGNKTIYNVIVSVGSMDSPNLLGQSFLRKLDRWSIDNSNKFLIIQ